jgi:hypothetical protein
VEARTKGERNRTQEQSCQALADCPARRGGRSALATRTVRPGAADSPARCLGQSGQKPRTVRKSQQNHQRRTGKNRLSERTRRTVRTGSGPSATELGPSTNRLQQKPITKPDHKKNTKNTRRTGLNWHLADGPRRRGGLSAISNRTEKTRAREVNSTNSSPEIPNGSSS